MPPSAGPSSAVTKPSGTRICISASAIRFGNGESGATSPKLEAVSGSVNALAPSVAATPPIRYRIGLEALGSSFSAGVINRIIPSTAKYDS